MALNNIRNEPQREITEQAVGVAVVLLAIVVDVIMAYWVDWYTQDWGLNHMPASIGILLIPIILTGVLFFVALAIIFVSIVVLAMHELGELICNKLQDRGIHLRPRNRVGRRQ